MTWWGGCIVLAWVAVVCGFWSAGMAIHAWLTVGAGVVVAGIAWVVVNGDRFIGTED